MNRSKISCLVGLGLALLASGCSTSSGAGPRSPYSFYITDDLTASHSSVVVTLHKVELKGETGSFTVFDNPAGIQVDLRALNDGNSLFMAIGAGAPPAGTYNKVEVYASKDLSLTATGSTTPTAAQFVDSLDSGVGRSKLEMNLTPPIVSDGTTGSLVIDFDLSRWTFAGGRVTPFLVRHGGGGLDDSGRHFARPFEGIVRGLSGSAPNQTFTLAEEHGLEISVQISADTSIFFDSGTASPVLANGLKVKVSGVMNPTTRVLAARAIKIDDDGNDANEAEAKGPVVEINSAQKSFVMAVRFGVLLPPAATRIKVETTASTVFFRRGGVVTTAAAFFEALTLERFVEAEGVFNASTGVLTARKVKFEDGPGDDGGHEAEAKGTARDINAEQSKFVIVLSEWEGFQGAVGMGVPVRAKSALAYKNNDGDVIPKADFFAALSNGSKVKAHGVYSEDGILADRLQLKD